MSYILKVPNMKNRKFTNEFVICIIISRTANTIDNLNPFKACANNGCATQKAQDRNQWICKFLYYHAIWYLYLSMIIMF